MKKHFLIIGSIATIITPISLVVSCGKKHDNNHKITSSSSSIDDSLSEGLTINNDEITIDFQLANLESSKFASDVLNFFNSHKGQNVKILLKNSIFEKINNHKIDYRVSINGFSSFEQFKNRVLTKIEDSFVDLNVEELESLKNLNVDTLFKDIAGENEKASLEAQRIAHEVEAQRLTHEAELQKIAHDQAWNDYQSKQTQANAMANDVAKVFAKYSSLLQGVPHPTIPSISLGQSASTESLNQAITQINNYINSVRMLLAPLAQRFGSSFLS